MERFCESMSQNVELTELSLEEQLSAQEKADAAQAAYGAHPDDTGMDM
jgi:hypothetical protein